MAGLRESAEGAELLNLRGKKQATGEIIRALKKTPGTVSIIAEFRRKGSTLGAIDVPPASILSREFRMAKAEVVSLLMDKTTGGCTVTDVTDMVKEQNFAKGDFPVFFKPRLRMHSFSQL